MIISKNKIVSVIVIIIEIKIKVETGVKGL